MRSTPASRRHSADLLVPSILATIFCCQIGGIIAIVFSAQANAARRNQQFEEAARLSKTASTWLWVSVLTPVLILGVAALTGMLGALLQR